MNPIKRLFKTKTCARSRSSDPKSAKVYVNEREVVIAPVLRDTVGFESGGEPLIGLPVDIDHVSLGRHVLAALKASKSGLAERQIEDAVVQMFRFFGVSDWEGLESDWKLIDVEQENELGQITVRPMRQYETGGYIRLSGDVLYQCQPVPEQVGEWVGRALHQLRVDCMDQPAAEVTLPDRSPPNLSSPSTTIPKSGDRVRDAWGNEGTVVHLDPSAEHGLGLVHIRFDDGRQAKVSLAASGMERIG